MKKFEDFQIRIDAFLKSMQNLSKISGFADEFNPNPDPHLNPNPDPTPDSNPKPNSSHKLNEILEKNYDQFKRMKQQIYDSYKKRFH